MFLTLLSKELREHWRTSKLLVVSAVFLITGLMSPLLAKYTPQLLRLVPDAPPELMAMIPEPTLGDAILQYTKNTVQFGTLLVIILAMGVVAQEKERGTIAMLLTKPVQRSAVVIAKWLALMMNVTVGLVLCGLACALYTAYLFEPLPLFSFTIANGFLLIFLGVYLTIALFASTLAKTQSVAAGGAFGGLILMLILGALPRIGDYFPSGLVGWGEALLLGVERPAWGALLVSVALILGLLLFACLSLEREEI